MQLSLNFANSTKRSFSAVQQESPNEFFNPSLSATLASGRRTTTTTASASNVQSRESHVAKKEKKRVKSYANVIHLIPVLLLVCGFILSLFSTPVDMSNKGDFSGSRVRI